MREKPILFSGEMVRAILDGRKTQTRRVVKPQPSPEWQKIVPGLYTPTVVRGGVESPGAEVYGFASAEEGWESPYGKPGDRLWVREKWSASLNGYPVCNLKPSEYDQASRIWYAAENNRPAWAETRWQPSIFMPRWASRIMLEVTAVRVERLQDISERDAVEEGIYQNVGGHRPCGGPGLTGWNVCEEFRELWESINADRDGGQFRWAANPWVWVVEFQEAGNEITIPRDLARELVEICEDAKCNAMSMKAEQPVDENGEYYLDRYKFRAESYQKDADKAEAALAKLKEVM